MNKNSIDWEALSDCPFYDPVIMKVDPFLTKPIINASNWVGYDLTYSFKYTPENFGVIISSEAYLYEKDVSVFMPLDQEKFIQTLTRCVNEEPKKFIWEDPEIYELLKDYILKLCEKSNKKQTRILLEFDHTYIFCNGTGSICRKDGFQVGAFSGIQMKIEKKEELLNLKLEIPNFVFKTELANLSEVLFSYKDNESNLWITFDGKELYNDNGIYKIRPSCNLNNIVIVKLKPGKGTVTESGSFEKLMSKKMKVVTSRFGIRLYNMPKEIANNKTIRPDPSIERIKNRLEVIQDNDRERKKNRELVKSQV